MSGGQDDIVRDQRAAAKARAVDEQRNLVLELAACCIFSSDDALGQLWEVS